jgi:hypothetical protein
MAFSSKFNGGRKLPEPKRKCPSCGGLNTSCPHGCGRDPKTGELNGTTYQETTP